MPASGLCGARRDGVEVEWRGVGWGGVRCGRMRKVVVEWGWGGLKGRAGWCGRVGGVKALPRNGQATK